MGAGGSESPYKFDRLGAGGVSIPKFGCSVAHQSEISAVFGFLKAAADELPKETIELTTGTLRKADSLAPIYWEFVLLQLDKVCLLTGLDWLMYLMTLMNRLHG